MFEVKRWMTTNVTTIAKDAPIYDAMNMLVKYSVSGLPVVDDDMTLLGIITEKDTLRTLAEEPISDRQPVSDFMSTQVISFKPSDSAVEICDFFMNNPFRRVPIVDNGKLVGIVSRRDLIKMILHFRGKKSL